MNILFRLSTIITLFLVLSLAIGWLFNLDTTRIYIILPFSIMIWVILLIACLLFDYLED